MTTKPSIHRDTSPSTVRPSGFQGQIKGATIPDLVQLECLSGVQRAVRVTSGSNVGVLFFRAGELVHAIFRSLTGEAAALDMLSWKEGTFEPVEREWPAQETISCHWQGLVLRAVQMQDEKQAQRVVALHSDSRADGRMKEGGRSDVGESMELQATPLEVADHIFRAEDFEVVVRLRPGGAIVQNLGGTTQDFADIVAYACRLAELIGGQLGIERFVAMECTFKNEQLFVVHERGGDVVALKPRRSADAGAIRGVLGI
jgi:Domain of unknown function (DUF4388)